MTETLAIDGGVPVREELLPYGRQTVSEEDIQAVVDVLRSDWLTTGPKVSQFEEAFADTVGAKFAVAVSSGTAALHAATFAAGIGPGDEAVTTPMTFAASANCVLYQGGKPVFADVDPETMNLSMKKLAEAITLKTKAIIPVDYTGQPADLDEINTLAKDKGLIVIEDAAHALGARYKNRTIGSCADMTIFSLHPVKHITTGEGGVVTTNSPNLAEQLRIFRNHGISNDNRQVTRSWVYEMTELGYNYRITDIQCALGLSQLSTLGDRLQRRREIASKYSSAFAGKPEIELPYTKQDRESAWHLYVIRLNLEQLTVGRQKVFDALRAENIGVNVHYIPVPWHPYYQDRGYEKGQWPVAEESYERMLSLPIWSGMTESDVDDTIAAVKRVVEAYRR